MHRYYTSMFDGLHIKHFNIHYTTEDMIFYSQVIRNKYQNEIQPHLMAWIDTEMHSYQLLEHSNWKPTRDAYEYSFMYMGYNKLFVYKHYYFQLGLYYYCRRCDDCKKEANRIHFELLLYGWDKKDPHVDKLQPENHNIILPHDLMIPKDFWIQPVVKEEDDMPWMEGFEP